MWVCYLLVAYFIFYGEIYSTNYHAQKRKTTHMENEIWKKNAHTSALIVQKKRHLHIIFLRYEREILEISYCMSVAFYFV